MNHTATAALLLTWLVGSACQPRAAESARAAAPTAADADAAMSAAAASIDSEFLRQQVASISDDEFEGRGPGTRGDVAARAHLVAELKALGLVPGGAGGSWEQPVELVGIRSHLPEKWTFERGGKSVALGFWEQFIAASGVQAETSRIDSAELVFVGYGIEAPEYGWDDFKGRSVAGKVLLVLNSDPDWDPTIFAGPTRLYYGRWTYKFENAARRGAVGALIVHTTPSAGYPFQVVQSSWGGEQFALPTRGEPSLQVKGWVSEAGAQALVGLGGQSLERLVESARSRDFAPVALGIRTSLRFDSELSRKQTANVIGKIPGADALLAEQAVVLTAHHDHLGIGKPDASGDAIYNGALDNGAGIAQVLSIARAFRALPSPARRSILVLLPAAEEAGLLGSQFFTEHPPLPAGRIAANINYDGGNIWGKARDITQIGRGKSSLDAVSAHVAARLGRTVRPDQFPDRGTFYRSDQFNFAKIGVPALYLKTGTDFVGRPAGWGKERILAFEAQRYHQPSDQLTAEWSFEGMVEDARFGFFAALEIANADSLPTWTVGDEFEKSRITALRALAP